MLNISKNLCSGCHGCANICPKKCITMVADEEGFLYPQIDQEKCIKCGLCQKRCPVLNKKKPEEKTPKAYAAYNKNLAVRMKSSSGGIFSLLAEKILTEGGVVFGAGFNDKFEVEHIAVDKVEDLDKLRTSKYVQSRIGTTYNDAKKFLDEGRTVLFTGTPCQIGGIVSFLGKEYENLYTQDIICHGVPSPLVWKKYVDYRQEKAKAVTASVSFRHKTDKWTPYYMKFTFGDDKKGYQKIFHRDPMLKMFFRHLCLRPACHNCSFKDKNRQSDITLADFWGIGNVAPDMYDGKGTSLVMVHSSKGQKLFESIKEQMVCKEVDFESAIKKNPSMTKSTHPAFRRAKFMKDLKKLKFSAMIFKYGKI